MRKCWSAPLTSAGRAPHPIRLADGSAVVRWNESFRCDGSEVGSSVAEINPGVLHHLRVSVATRALMEEASSTSLKMPHSPKPNMTSVWPMSVLIAAKPCPISRYPRSVTSTAYEHRERQRYSGNQETDQRQPDRHCRIRHICPSRHLAQGATSRL